MLGYYTLNDCPVRQPYVPRTSAQLEKLREDIFQESKPHVLMHSVCCRLIYRRALLPLAHGWQSWRRESVAGTPDPIFGVPNDLGVLLSNPLPDVEKVRFERLREQGWIERALRGEVNPALMVTAIQRPQSLQSSMYLRQETEQAMLNEWELCRTILAEVLRIASDHSIPMHFLIIPNPYQVDPSAVTLVAEWGVETQPEMLVTRKQNDLVLNFCRDTGTPDIDPLDLFREKTRSGAKLFFPMDSHLTPAGHELLADVLAEHLAKQRQSGSRAK